MSVNDITPVGQAIITCPACGKALSTEVCLASVETQRMVLVVTFRPSYIDHEDCKGWVTH